MRLKEDGIGKGEATYLGMKDKESQTRLDKGENERMGNGIRPYMSRFANNVLLGGWGLCWGLD